MCNWGPLDWTRTSSQVKTSSEPTEELRANLSGPQLSPDSGVQQKQHKGAKKSLLASAGPDSHFFTRWWKPRD